jgi:hypothetical protein
MGSGRLTDVYTLLKKLPLRRVLGNLVEAEKVLVGLGLNEVADDVGSIQP